MSRHDQLNEIRDRAKASKGAQAGSSGAAMSTKASKPKAIAVFYDACRGGCWTQNTRHEWVSYTEASIRRMLRHCEAFATDDKNLQLHLIEKELIMIQTEKDVVYAGPIAGYKAGIHTICGQRVLVTSGPKMLTPKAGDWQFLKKFFEDLLGDAERRFYAWMKSALRSFYAGPSFRPGQALAIAGPAGCGKSLLQNLITEMLGGRSAKPYRYLTGDTAFNSDLLKCEHLMIEDEAASYDVRVRRTFGSQIKNMLVNEVQSLHPKGKDALSVSPFWRITITVNDEPENLMVLPVLDESLKDKITLMRAFTPKFPYAADDMQKRKDFRARLSNELPAFLFWLKTFRIPDAWVNQRYGVVAFHDSLLIQALDELSPEMKLLSLIDSLQIWDLDRNPWEGTANELEERLLEKDKSGRVQKILGFNSACGTYLARLRVRFPDRVSEKRTHGSNRTWTIKPPSR